MSPGSSGARRFPMPATARPWGPGQATCGGGGTGFNPEASASDIFVGRSCRHALRSSTSLPRSARRPACGSTTVRAFAAGGWLPRPTYENRTNHHTHEGRSMKSPIDEESNR